MITVRLLDLYIGWLSIHEVVQEPKEDDSCDVWCVSRHQQVFVCCRA